MKKVLFGVLVVTCHFLWSQRFVNYVAGMNSASVEFTFEKERLDTDGTPYRFSSWQKGNFVLSSGQEVTSDSINLNTFTGDLVVLYGGEKYIIPKSKVVSASLGGTVFENISIELNKGLLSRILFDEEEIRLFSITETSIMRGRESYGYTPKINDRYVHEERYFLDIANTRHEISYKRGFKIIPILPPQVQEKIISFIASERLKLKSEEDLITVIEFYSSIQ